MKIEDLKDQSSEELLVTLKELRKETFQLRTEAKASAKTEEPHLIRQKRRTAARILTLLRQRELNTKRS